MVRDIKKISLQFFNIILTSVLIYLFIKHQDYQWVTFRSITTLSIILLCLQMFQFMALKVRFYDFRIWFILLLNLFLLGRVYVAYFFPEYRFFWIQFDQYPPEVILKALFYSVVVAQVFFTSFLFFNTKTIKFKIIDTFMNDEKFIFKVGIIMFIFSLPFRLLIDIVFIIRVHTSGTFLSVEAWSGISDIMAMFFVPSIIFLLNSIKPRYRKPLVIVTVLYFVAVMAFTGDRRYQTTSIIAITLAYFVTKSDKLGFWKFVKLSVIVYLGLAFFVALRNIRGGSMNIDMLWTQLTTQSYSFDIILETMSEFGLSFFSLAAIIYHIPMNYPYIKGLSFYGSIPSLLPVGWLFGDFFKVVSISRTINKFPGGYPVGATIAGDFYANFGNYAFVFIFIFGLLLSKIFNLSSREDRDFSYSSSVYFSLFYILINLVRASFFEVFRSSVYIYFAPIIIGIVFSSIINRRKVVEISYSDPLQQYKHR